MECNITQSLEMATQVYFITHIKKLQCANHAVKNCTERPYGPQKDSAVSKQILSSATLKRLKIAARGAIIHNSKTGDVSGLQQDLINGPRHVFGNRASCKPHFCRKFRETADLSEKLQHAYEKATSCLQPVISKCHQLISNRTRNAAENYMALSSSPKLRSKTPEKANNGAQDYGELATQLDIEDKEMEDLKKQKLQDLTSNDNEITALKIETRGQNENEKWCMARKDRLTGSNFGYAYAAKKLLYLSYRSRAMEYGCNHEGIARRCFECNIGITCESLTYGFLDASPDGVVEDDAII
ncbi:hypothetical protein PR048_026737 [Dryococelus australis]|uniref:Uncharacterized protein n=1 Tax=Dryococelus australis TaxID=614101 RepID=A0ABQ9GM72_9NEOP|nr:hypothetical protein PR048_026737 [Dryococelus australis]